MTHHIPFGQARVGRYAVALDAAAAGWRFSGFHLAELGPGERLDRPGTDCEWIAVPLSGSFEVGVGAATFALEGRRDVFAGPTDVVYVPRDTDAVVWTRDGGRIAFPSAAARRRLEPQYLAARDVPLSVRGAGSMTRLAREFCMGGGVKADRLLALEVITPSGNWSSYPPHKHDVDAGEGGELALEELYYYEVAAGPGGPGCAYQRVVSADERPLDLLAEVRTGDVVTIPHGWHGPSMAAPGYDLYYLNVMAGATDERAWRFSDEPTTAWVRDTWADTAPDPRVLRQVTRPDA